MYSYQKDILWFGNVGEMKHHKLISPGYHQTAALSRFKCQNLNASRFLLQFAFGQGIEAMC